MLGVEKLAVVVKGILKWTATREVGKDLTEHSARNRKFEYHICSTGQQ